MERTLIILKPDAVARGLIGAIIGRFEQKGFQIAAMKLARIAAPTARQHYAMHQGKPFYEGLIEFITSGPVVLLVLEGNGAIETARKMMGATFGFKAEPGTIRGDFGLSSSFNLIHGSDSPAAAQAEISRFFTAEELLACPSARLQWVYDEAEKK